MGTLNYVKKYLNKLSDRITWYFLCLLTTYNLCATKLQGIIAIRNALNRQGEEVIGQPLEVQYYIQHISVFIAQDSMLPALVNIVT